jgi:hypothetical protein
MSLLSSIRVLLTSVFRRLQIEREMEEELRSHLQSRADDLQQQGLSRAEAERQGASSLAATSASRKSAATPWVRAGWGNSLRTCATVCAC